MGQVYEYASWGAWWTVAWYFYAFYKGSIYTKRRSAHCRTSKVVAYLVHSTWIHGLSVNWNLCTNFVPGCLMRDYLWNQEECFIPASLSLRRLQVFHSRHTNSLIGERWLRFMVFFWDETKLYLTAVNCHDHVTPVTLMSVLTHSEVLLIIFFT